MKAIAFDLGRVLFDFDYDIALDKIRDKIQVSPQEIIYSFFYEDFTLDFERGTVSALDFYHKFKDKTGLSLGYDEFVPVWCDIFSLKEETISLVKYLKPFYRVFLISNINELHYNFLKERHPDVFSLFEEEILSFAVKAVKPEPEIYNILLSKAACGRRELVYIDDRADLIASARSQGLNCIQFQDIDQCRQELSDFGVRVPSCRT